MIYTIYAGPGQQSPDDLVAIPESLAPWALVAPPIWLIMQRLWWWLAGYLLFVILTSAISATPYAAVAMVLSWLPGVFFMLEGRELCRRKLEEQGMMLVGIVNADTEDEAIARHALREDLNMPSWAGLDETVMNSRSNHKAGRPAEATDSADMFGLFSPRGS